MVHKKRLAIFDIGNSRTKVRIIGLGDEQAGYRNVTIEEAIAEADAAVAGASGNIEDLHKLLNAAGVKDILIVDHNTPLPIAIRYSEGRLGVDRAAAACGVDHPALIADAGTALTLDVVAYDNSQRLTFFGGNISAGLQMRLDALHNATHLLPHIIAREWDANPKEHVIPEDSIIGYDTHSAMILGALGGMAAETIAIAYAARARFGINEIIITGGDAELLFKAVSLQLKHQPQGNFKLRISTDLTTDGLRNIYCYNTK